MDMIKVICTAEVNDTKECSTLAVLVSVYL